MALCSHKMIPSDMVLDITSRIFGPARKRSLPTNTTHYGASGQNKKSKYYEDRVDIALISCKWKEELDKWYEEEPDTMKSSVFHLGKPLAVDVKEARSQGKRYLTLKFTSNTISFKLNIGPSTTVEKTDLTKVRFFAILLRYLHDAAQREPDPESKGFKSSSLVGRVEFDPGNPLFKYRFLLGEGFHLNHDLFEGAEQIHLFLLGCILLDYLHCHSIRNLRYENCKNSQTFVEYVRSSAAKTGDTLVAGMRHSGISWSALNQNLPLLEAKAQMFKIHPKSLPSGSSGFGDRYPKCQNQTW